MSVYCPHCGWRQKNDVLMSCYRGNGHSDIVFTFRCEFCNEKIRAEIQDTALGDLL